MGKESEGEMKPEVSGVAAVDEKVEGGLAESTEDEDDEKQATATAEVPKRTSSRRSATSPLGRSASKLSSPITPKRSSSETMALAQTPSSSRRSARATSASTTVTPSRRSTRKTSGSSPAMSFSVAPTKNPAKEEIQSSEKSGSPGNTSRSSKRKSLSSPRVSSPTTTTTPPTSSKKRSMSSPLAATQSSTRKSARGKATKE